MHRFFSLACAVAAATSLVVACGSSDDSGPGSTAGSGNAAGSGNSAGAGGSSAGGSTGSQTCAAPAYADVPASEFASKAVAGKACSSDSDLTDLCNEDLAGLGASCGKTCLLQGGDDATQATCVAACIDQGLSAGATPPSDACMSCYTADVQCARKECLAQCLASPTSDTCTQCRIDMGCLQVFYDCSGAPLPTGLNLGAAGATGAAGGGS